MTDDALFVGVDYCDGDWLAAVFDTDGFDHADIFDGIGELWARYEEDAERILVAIPIGLVEEGNIPRPCEAAAREVLGPRSTAVFDPPVREAARKRRFPAASRVNERKAGRRLTKEAFASSDGIVAVDELLQEVPEARPIVAEAHPEVCYRAFAGTTLEREKGTAGGYAERMRALVTFTRDAPPVVQECAEATAGHDIAVHDVLDAVALGYTARSGPGSLRSLPADPPTDATGLPMGMRYRAATPLEPS